MSTVRITVLRRAVYEDLQSEYLDRTAFPSACGPCERMREGQCFEIRGPYPEKPEAFGCWDAWIDIQRPLSAILYGANLPWVREKGVAIACCGDGLRPVSFRIERVS